MGSLLGGIRLTWTVNTIGNDGQRVYRSLSPMDRENLPSPLAEIAPEIDYYNDITVDLDRLYYYRVSAFDGEVEEISAEAEAFSLSVEEYIGSTERQNQCTACGSYNSGYTPSKAFNGDNSDAWISNVDANANGSCWIQWDFLTQKKFVGVSLKPRTSTWNPYPLAVGIFGSDDPSFASKTHIGDISFPQVASGAYTDWRYQISSQAFRHYRMEVYSRQTPIGGSNYSRVCIGEAKFKIS